MILFVDADLRSDRHAVCIGIDRTQETATDLVLRVASGHQDRQLVETLLHPRVVDTSCQLLEVFLVNVDRPLLERKCLLLDDELVVDQLCFAQP